MKLNRSDENFAPKIIQAGLFFVFILSPLFFGAYHAWASMPACAVLFSLIFFSPDSLASVRKIPIFFLSVAIFLLAYLLIQAVSLSADPSATRIEFLKWLACAAAFLLVQRLPAFSNELLLKAAVTVAVAEACLGLTQAVTGYDGVLWRKQELHLGFATGTFFNRNHFAGLLQLGMGIQTGYLLKALKTGNKNSAILNFLLLLLTFTALVKSGSRMGLVSFGFSVLACGAFLRFREKSFSVWTFWIILASVATLAFFLGKQEIISRFSDAGLWEQSWGGRNTAWQNTLAMIRGHFWLGTGLGNYAWIFPQYQSGVLLGGWTHAHNDYLELTSGLGAPVFLFWSVAFCGFLLYCFRQALAMKQNDAFPLVWGALWGLFSFMIHGLADFNWAVSSNALWFFIILSAVYGLMKQEENRPLKPAYRNLVRLAALCLILLSAQKAWAGAGLYVSERAFFKNDFPAALRAAENALKIDPQNRTLQFLLGKSLFEEGQKTSAPVLLTKAEEVFTGLARTMPFYGRTWAYLGLCQESLAGKDMTPEKWAGIKTNFDKALALEPGSAWISYMSSTVFLRNTGLLSDAGREQATERLRFSLNAHYEGQASAFLLPALRFSWDEFKDIQFILKIVPHDFASYRELLGFIEKNNLWPYRDQVENDLRSFIAVEYAGLCAQGWGFLSKAKAREAFDSFQRAYWMRQETAEAKTGMLIAGPKAGPGLYSPDQANQWLKDILEQEEEEISSARLDGLKAAVQAADNLYLQGLWAYRKGRWQQALERFERDQNSYARTRRWRADSLQKLERAQDALEVLGPVLNESNPDLRELILLKQLDETNRKSIESKIRGINERERNGRLIPQSAPGLLLNLMPGTYEVTVLMKSAPYKGSYGYISFRLWEGDRLSRTAGTAYVSSERWKTYRQTFATAGGFRLLAIKLENGPKNPGLKGPAVEYGPVKVSLKK